MGQAPLASFRVSVPSARVVLRRADELHDADIYKSWWLDTEDGEDVADFNRFGHIEHVMQPGIEKSFSLMFDCEYFLQVGGGRRVLSV